MLQSFANLSGLRRGDIRRAGGEAQFFEVYPKRSSLSGDSLYAYDGELTCKAYTLEGVKGKIENMLMIDGIETDSIC